MAAAAAAAVADVQLAQMKWQTKRKILQSSTTILFLRVTQNKFFRSPFRIYVCLCFSVMFFARAQNDERNKKDDCEICFGSCRLHSYTLITLLCVISQAKKDDFFFYFFGDMIII